MLSFFLKATFHVNPVQNNLDQTYTNNIIASQQVAPPNCIYMQDVTVADTLSDVTSGTFDNESVQFINSGIATGNEYSTSDEQVEVVNIVSLVQDVNQMKNDISEMKTMFANQAKVLADITATTVKTNLIIDEFLKMSSNMVKGDVNVATNDSNENFEDLSSMQKIKTPYDLKQFEELLSDDVYQQRFIRYLATKHKLDGARNGAVLFTMVIRELTDAQLFLPYSWKGSSRKGVSNISFSGEHKTFIQFMTKLVRTADRLKVADDIEGMFAKLLRFKNQNEKREFTAHPSPRNRVPKQTNKTDATENSDGLSDQKHEVDQEENSLNEMQ